MHSLNLQLSLPSLPLHLFLPKSQDDVGVSQQGLLRGFPTTTSPCSHTDLAQCQAKSLASLSATSPKPATESDHNSPGSRCLSENTGEIGTKKPENAGCTQRPQKPGRGGKISPPQQTTDLSASAEGMKVAVGLLFLIRYGICSLLSKQNNAITVMGWGRLKYPKPTSGGFP